MKYCSYNKAKLKMLLTNAEDSNLVSSYFLNSPLHFCERAIIIYKKQKKHNKIPARKCD